MVRISDILRGNLGPDPDESPDESKKDPAKKEAKGPSEKEPSKDKKSEDIPSSEGMKVSEAMNQKGSSKETSEVEPQDMQIVKAMKDFKPDKEHYKSLYDSGIQLAHDVLNCVAEGGLIDLVRIKGWIAGIVDHLVSGDKELINHFYESTPENYLHGHMVNAMIMSLEIGLGSGYNKSRLNELGLAAFLYDIGMADVEDVFSQPRPLTEEEYSQIREHPGRSAELLSRIEAIPEVVIRAVKEHHERMDGGGYPSGIKSNQIAEYARIIAVVDVYEALTHERPHRKRFSPHEAIKEILTTYCSFFDPRILRILVSQLGIYPIGSWVELNTREIGKVITTNSEFPLRPVVKLIFDSSKNQLEVPHIVNLSKQVNLFIKGPLHDRDVLSQIKESDKH